MKFVFYCKFIVAVTILSQASMGMANPGIYHINSKAAPGAKVYLAFSQNDRASAGTYGFDPYGTFTSGFPSMNDHGDIAGRAAFTYINPYTGYEITQWEAAVWIEGKIHRFGVYRCMTSTCQSRALKISNTRNIIIGSSHGVMAGSTPYYERSIKWSSDNNQWNTHFGGLEANFQSVFMDLNEQGNIVGSAFVVEDYMRHAYAILDGKLHIIGTNMTQSLGLAINNSNDVVGSIRVDNIEKAFHWNNKLATPTPTVLQGLSQNPSIAYDINDDSLIVGAALNHDYYTRAVKWKNNNIMEIGTLGGKTSVARAVNNNGIIVGYSETASNHKHAFVYMNDVLYDLNNFSNADPGWKIVDAYSVNRHGQILVRAQKNNSIASEDNAYWILSPADVGMHAGPKFAPGNAYCQWGKNNCEIEYPPTAVENQLYKMPDEPLPEIADNLIPVADAYVCNANCFLYSNFTPHYNSINQALKNTNANATIVIFPGEYHEVIKFSNRKIIGLNPNFTIINADGMNMRPVKMNSLAELHGVAITGGNALDGGGIQVSGINNKISNTIIQGNTASRNGGGIHGLTNSAFELRYSILSNNKAKTGGGYVGWNYSSADISHTEITGNEAELGAGVFFASYARVTFNSNIVANNHAVYDGGGVYVNSYTTDKYVRNSLIINNTAGRYGAGVYRGGLLGSVVYGNEAGDIKYSAIFGTLAQNSIIWGNAGTHARLGIRDSIVEGELAICNYCSNVKNADPMFVDPQNGDFRLQAGSPAIDAGADTSNVYTLWQDEDFNGIPRGLNGDQLGVSEGNDYDIGAFEFVPGF